VPEPVSRSSPEGEISESAADKSAAGEKAVPGESQQERRTDMYGRRKRN
jgi:hypothetical protein